MGPIPELSPRCPICRGQAKISARSHSGLHRLFSSVFQGRLPFYCPRCAIRFRADILREITDRIGGDRLFNKENLHFKHERYLPTRKHEDLSTHREDLCIPTMIPRRHRNLLKWGDEEGKAIHLKFECGVLGFKVQFGCEGTADAVRASKKALLDITNFAARCLVNLAELAILAAQAAGRSLESRMAMHARSTSEKETATDVVDERLASNTIKTQGYDPPWLN